MNESTLIHCKRFKPFIPVSFPMSQDTPAGEYEDIFMTQEEYDALMAEQGQNK
jgi:hypothetical protein